MWKTFLRSQKRFSQAYYDCGKRFWDLRNVFRKHIMFVTNVFVYVFLKRKIFSDKATYMSTISVSVTFVPTISVSRYFCDSHITFVITISVFLFFHALISVNEKNNFIYLKDYTIFFLMKNFYLLLGSNPRPRDYEPIVLPMLPHRIDIWQS